MGGIMENGKWKVENGKWKVENGSHLSNQFPIDILQPLDNLQPLAGRFSTFLYGVIGFYCFLSLPKKHAFPNFRTVIKNKKIPSKIKIKT